MCSRVISWYCEQHTCLFRIFINTIISTPDWYVRFSATSICRLCKKCCLVNINEIGSAYICYAKWIVQVPITPSPLYIDGVGGLHGSYGQLLLGEPNSLLSSANLGRVIESNLTISIIEENTGLGSINSREDRQQPRHLNSFECTKNCGSIVTVTCTSIGVKMTLILPSPSPTTDGLTAGPNKILSPC